MCRQLSDTTAVNPWNTYSGPSMNLSDFSSRATMGLTSVPVGEMSKQLSDW